MHFEGRDLTDDDAYMHLLEKYNILYEEFYERLHDETYKEKAYYEFALCRQLRVDGYPALFLQVSDSKFHQLAKGYTDYETLQERIGKILADSQ